MYLSFDASHFMLHHSPRLRYGNIYGTPLKISQNGPFRFFGYQGNQWKDVTIIPNESGTSIRNYWCMGLTIFKVVINSYSFTLYMPSYFLCLYQVSWKYPKLPEWETPTND